MPTPKAIGWTWRKLAAAFGYSPPTGETWRKRGAVPAHVVEWLERAAAWHAANPPPRRDAADTSFQGILEH